MATTKNYAIRSIEALRKSIIYIQNEKKTKENGEILVTGIDCSKETAFEEFLYCKKKFNKDTIRYGFHIKQNFKPGEIDGKKAHEIGVKLAEKHLKRKYQCVVATHVDKKHIHNHIVFNSTSKGDGREYKSTLKDYYRLRRESDDLCREYNLSVVEPKNKGKKYEEWMESLRGNSWKDKIKDDIDLAVKETKTYNALITYLIKKGYKIKQGKYISYKPPSKERFVRGKTLGYDYTENGIKERFEFKKLDLKIVTITIGQKQKRYKLVKTEKRKIYYSKNLVRLSFLLGIRLIKKFLRKGHILRANTKIISDKTVQRFEKQLKLIDDEKINTPEKFDECITENIKIVFEIQRKRRILDKEKIKIEKNLNDLEIIKKYIDFAKSRKDSPEKRAFKVARERLLNQGIKDTGVEKGFKEKLRKIEYDQNRLKNEYEFYDDKKDMLYEIGDTIRRILNKEKPFDAIDKKRDKGRDK